VSALAAAVSSGLRFAVGLEHRDKSPDRIDQPADPHDAERKEIQDAQSVVSADEMMDAETSEKEGDKKHQYWIIFFMIIHKVNLLCSIFAFVNTVYQIYLKTIGKTYEEFRKKIMIQQELEDIP